MVPFVMLLALSAVMLFASYRTLVAFYTEK
jgi:hypothetical protein